MADELKVLICDEDPNRRVTTRKAAERARFGVAGEVGYGTQAVSLALDAQPDVILIAVEEPVGRALDTAEALANVLPDTPIVVCSSIYDPEAMRRAMLLGARDYLFQPVEADQLREAINSVLAQEELRQMRRAGQLATNRGRGTVVTVTGAKCGIGKTVCCVNISLGLRRECDMSVAILDADIQFGDVATMLNISPSRTIGDLMPKLDQLDRDNIHEFLTEHESGVEVLAATEREEVWTNCTNEGLKRIIDLLAQNYDFVLIDTAGSFDRLTRACIEASTLTLVVTSGEVSSIRDTASAIRRMESWEIPPDRFKVLLNRGAKVNGVHLDDLSQAVNSDIFWQIPYDKRVPESVQLGQPVVLYNDGSTAARTLLALSRMIAGTKKSLVQQPRKSLVNRLFKFSRGRGNPDAIGEVLAAPSPGFPIPVGEGRPKAGVTAG